MRVTPFPCYVAPDRSRTRLVGPRPTSPCLDGQCLKSVGPLPLGFAVWTLALQGAGRCGLAWLTLSRGSAPKSPRAVTQQRYLLRTGSQ